jgi:hypothetical protein
MSKGLISRRNSFKIGLEFYAVLLHLVWVLIKVIFNQLFIMIYQDLLKIMYRKLEEQEEMVHLQDAICF